MVIRKRKNIIHISHTPVGENECIWKGKPSFIAFLLVRERLLGFTVVTLLLCFYLRFKWFLPLQVWMLFYVFCTVKAVFRFTRITYYMTVSEMIVQIGKKYYRFPYDRIQPDEYRVISHPLEKLFDCRTIQYGICLGYHTSRGSNANLWKDSARFWCIRDYKLVNDVISKKVTKLPCLYTWKHHK